MAKPVILTVDDDADVLRAIERDLRQHYSDRYRILRADSGIAALDLLRRLKQRNDSVALLDDLLDDWSADFHPPFEGVRVLGTRWSPKSYDVRDFLARNPVPYQWLDADASDREPEVKR